MTTLPASVARPPLTFAGAFAGAPGSSPGEQLRTALQAVRDVPAAGRIVRLGVFYDPGAFGDRVALIDAIAARLAPGERPALSAVPVPASPGAPFVQVEAVLYDGTPQHVGDGAFADAVVCGDLVFTSAVHVTDADADVAEQSQRVLDRLREVLKGAGSGLDDSCKLSIFYVGGGTAQEWEVAARVRARAFAEPGPAATGIPVATLGAPGALISMELVALRGAAADRAARTFSWPEGHWDWPVHLPWKHGNAAAGMAWVGGQVALTPQATVLEPGDLAAQARIAVDNIGRVLAELGFSLSDLVKVTAFIAGTPDGACSPIPLDGDAATLPAATHVWLPFLAYEEMVIEIEAIAMRAPP